MSYVSTFDRDGKRGAPGVTFTLSRHDAEMAARSLHAKSACSSDVADFCAQAPEACRAAGVAEDCNADTWRKNRKAAASGRLKDVLAACAAVSAPFYVRLNVTEGRFLVLRVQKDIVARVVSPGTDRSPARATPSAAFVDSALEGALDALDAVPGSCDVSDVERIAFETGVDAETLKRAFMDYIAAVFEHSLPA